MIEIKHPTTNLGYNRTDFKCEKTGIKLIVYTDIARPEYISHLIEDGDDSRTYSIPVEIFELIKRLLV